MMKASGFLIYGSIGASMKSFWIGSIITILLVSPIVLFLISGAYSNTTTVSKIDNSLEEPGKLPQEIFTPREECSRQLSQGFTGAVSAECQNYEAFLTSEFVNKVKEAVSSEETVECARNLPADLSTLHKKIEGNKAQVIIEGNSVITGQEPSDEAGDLQVEFIRTEDDWEITDIRCLN